MFTGIIEAVGTLKTIEPRGGDVRLSVTPGNLDTRDIKLGDSVAVSGVCLTVVQFSANELSFDASNETLQRTALRAWRPGDKVNLEKALLPTTRLGGHLVSGHVDGIGTVVARVPDARSVRFRIEVPAVLLKYIAEKGSVCVDGVSLTVNVAEGNAFDLNIVPHTLSQTTFAEFNAGRVVNVEVDILARYLERLLKGEANAEAPQSLTRDVLARYGFA